MNAKRKPHAVDLRDAQWIAAATSFAAHYRAGPQDATTVPCKSAAEALAKAEELTRTLGKFGRRACAYAMTDEGRQAHITPHLLALARQMQGMGHNAPIEHLSGAAVQT